MSVEKAVVADALAELDQSPDPYPLYARLRQESPVHEARPGVYLLSRYADCRTVLTDAGCYDAPGLDRSSNQAGPAAVLAGVMSGQHGARHRRMRAAVTAPWAAALRRILPRLPALCDRVLQPVIARLAAGEVVDLHDCAEAFPVDTILLLLGLPLGDRDVVRAIIPAIFQVSGPVPGSAPTGDPETAMRELLAYLAAGVRDRRSSPGDNVISHLIATRRDHPDLLDETELMSILVGLLVAGYSQIAAAIETALVLVLRSERHRRWLDDDPSRFTAELLRWDAPVQTPPFPRIPARDVTLGGTVIPAGATIWPLLGAANRDPARFPRPDEFDPPRAPHPPLSFGGGIHHCLGARLAREEISMLAHRMTARTGALALAAEPTPRIGRLRGFTSVPARLEAMT